MVISTLIAIALAAQAGQPAHCAVVNPRTNTVVMVFRNKKVRVSRYTDRDVIRYSMPVTAVTHSLVIHQKGTAVRLGCSSTHRGFTVNPR